MLIVRLREARIRGNARDIQAIAHRWSQQLSRHPYVFRDVAGIVYDSVPAPSAQRVELPFSISDEGLDSRYAFGGAFPAIEVGDLPTAAQCFLRQVRPNESGAPQDQKRFGLPLRAQNGRQGATGCCARSDS